MSRRVESILEVQIYPGQSTAFFHCLVLYPVCPLDHHLYSSVCTEAILGAFHDRIVFRELSESACDYKHDQLNIDTRQNGENVNPFGAIAPWLATRAGHGPDGSTRTSIDERMLSGRRAVMIV